LRGIASLLELGWIIALSIFVPLGIGLWLDHQLSTSPLFILIGAVFGIIVSTVGVVRIAIRNIHTAEQTAKADEENKGEE
jgi:F0F1-type ATP synthase assembly protein I